MNKNNKNNKNNNKCSPGNVYDKTCFNLSALKNIATKLNNNNVGGGSKIDVKNYNSKNKGQLINDIQSKLNCNKKIDLCILDKKGSFYKEIKEFFKPKGPGGKKWLSTLDIKNVMEQYMKKYPEFIFYGPVPLDFNDFYTELQNINIKRLEKNKNKIGVIFNLDYSHQPGSHWVSLFVDLKGKTICFFDSNGDKPPKEIRQLIKKIKTSAKASNINLKTIINEKQHQFKDSECGVYSMYFLASRLSGKSCDFLFDKIIKDDSMNKKRKVFFN
jgi:hypothetical protein